ncbi:hypothetical protein BJX96DRAFT_97882 [Aspergillus floccosus]
MRRGSRRRRRRRPEDRRRRIVPSARRSRSGCRLLWRCRCLRRGWSPGRCWGRGRRWSVRWRPAADVRLGFCWRAVLPEWWCGFRGRRSLGAASA